MLLKQQLKQIKEVLLAAGRLNKLVQSLESNAPTSNVS